MKQIYTDFESHTKSDISQILLHIAHNRVVSNIIGDVGEEVYLIEVHKDEILDVIQTARLAYNNQPKFVPIVVPTPLESQPLPQQYIPDVMKALVFKNNETETGLFYALEWDEQEKEFWWVLADWDYTIEVK